MERLDAYISALREQCAKLPDKRFWKNVNYSMADIGMAAFSVFLMQSPSFLQHQKALEEMRDTSNAHTLFGMTMIPCDNHIRQTLDGAPIRDGKDSLIVNWLEIEIAKPNGKITYRNSFITDLTVNRETVAEIAACGRARWKIENESFNVLKNSGFNLEHNFGHGKDALASILVVLNLLAFAMHNACDLAESLWQGGRQKVGARMRLFEHIRSLTVYLVFPSWTSLLRTIRTARPPRQPP